MLKIQLSDILNLATQTIPFVVITVTFIIIAYLYGHTVRPTILKNSIEYLCHKPTEFSLATHE